MDNLINFLEFQEKVGINFKNQNLLKEALTHRSYINENPSWDVPHNERLEFLGDAVLELIITENLFEKYPQHDEGTLTSVRAALVNYVSLSKIAREIGLGDYIFMSKGEAKDVGKAREVILANAIEAFLGAVYLDQGYGVISEFIKKTIFIYTDEIIEKSLYRDSKSLFQEIVQDRFKVTPSYQVIEESGPEHKKIFKVGVFVKSNKIADGEGYSKQEAEVEAAKNALYVFKAS